MSKLADTLRKDGWKFTPCKDLRPGDYVAAINGHCRDSEGEITDVVDNKNGTFAVYYGGLGLEVLPAKTGALWVAPKKYEHLESRWDTDGTRYINISTDPREPIFCLASYITFKHVFNPDNRDAAFSSCKNPETLLKEKPIKVEAHAPRSNNTPQEQSNNTKE